MIDFIILAGGKGERLKPGFEGPKALVPVGNRTLIEHQLDKILPMTNRVIISLGYLAEEIKDWVDHAYKSDKIIFIKEGEPLGTGGALKYVIDHVPNLSKFFFVINVDDLTDFNLTDFIPVEGNAIALGNFRCPYGVVKTHGTQIVSFQQKPVLKDIWVSIGHYKLYKDDIYPLLCDKCSLEDDIFPKISLTAIKHRGFWVTINDSRQLKEAMEFYGKN